MQQYQAIIDLQDIVSAQKFRQENKSSQFISDIDIKKNYKYDYYIQVELSCTDGKMLKRLFKRDRKQNSPQARVRRISEEETAMPRLSGMNQSVMLGGRGTMALTKQNSDLLSRDLAAMSV